LSNICIHSEVGHLEKVIVHRPGREVELMSPQDAQAALYDDIIHQPWAAQEHDQLAAALAQFGTVYELNDLLVEVLGIDDAREELVQGLTRIYNCPGRGEELLDLPPATLARQLMLGTPARHSTLSRFLAGERYDIPPLYNLYFTRDVAMCVDDRVIVGAMRNQMRRGEALVTRVLFAYHPELVPEGFYFDGSASHSPEVTIEGGDVLVLREDTVIIGQSERTSVAGIDRMLERFQEHGRIRYVVVQEIPVARAFIHFDMVFTMVDRELCVIHAPVINGPSTKRPVLVELEPGKPPRLEYHDHLLALLAELGLPLTPIRTGGADALSQGREQWNKGTNFFAMAPGKIIGYGRNPDSYRELAEHGFRVVSGHEVMAGDVDLTAPGRIAVAMEGIELSRGGGGCRCMTLPLKRQPLF
jgi:arginine deiminase